MCYKWAGIERVEVDEAVFQKYRWSVGVWQIEASRSTHLVGNLGAEMVHRCRHKVQRREMAGGPSAVHTQLLTQGGDGVGYGLEKRYEMLEMVCVGCGWSAASIVYESVRRTLVSS